MSTLAKYPKATAIAIYSLGAFLGVIHLFFGLTSLTPVISADYNREMRINFNAYSKSLGFLHDFIDRATLALYLRYAVALAQVVGGLLLLENGHFGSFSRYGNQALIGVDSLILIFQLISGTSYERIAPNFVFSVLLVTRLLITIQGSRKGKVGVKTRNAGKVKTSTPKKNKSD